MRQFFVEALMIVTMGATLGLLLSFGLVAALGALPIKEFVGVPTISPSVLAATLALLATGACAAGLMPATVASRASVAASTLGEIRSEEHTSEIQSTCKLVCRLLLL